MAINEQQLITWSHQGSITLSSDTYNSIKSCIDKINWNSDISYEIYLTGSYKNSTNIRANSDVDVLVEFKSIFHSNKNELPPDQLKEFNEYYADGKYTLEVFKQAVIKGLSEHYGTENVVSGNRSIKIKGTNGKLNSDVVCCAEYREYKSFLKAKTSDYAQGITYWETNTFKQIINFPKLHYENGTEKNSNAYLKYKPSTRIFKNMKAKLIDKNLITSKLAPSFFLENLIFNAPNLKFNHSNYSEIVYEILEYLSNQADNNKLDSFICQNKQRKLFGNSDQQWNVQDCKEFLLKLINLWNEG
jgi:hypothetical protein